MINYYEHCAALTDPIQSGQRVYHHLHPVAAVLYLIALSISIAMAVCAVGRYLKNLNKQ